MRLVRNKGLFLGFVINAIVLAALVYVSFKHSVLNDGIRDAEKDRRDIAVSIHKTTALVNGMGNQSKGYALTKNGAFLFDLNQEEIRANLRFLRLRSKTENAKSLLSSLDTIVAALVQQSLMLVSSGKTYSNNASAAFAEENTRLLQRFQLSSADLLEAEEEYYKTFLTSANRKEKAYQVYEWILLFTSIALLFVVYFLINFYFRVRKKAEESLAQNKSLLQSVIDSSSNPVFIKQLSGQYILVNKRFEKLVQQHDLIGKTDYEILPQDLADRFRESDLQIIREGKELRYEESFGHDSTQHTFLMVKFPVRDAKGKLYAVGCIATDITEQKRRDAQLKENEEQVNAVFTAGPDAVIAIDEDAKIIRWNDKAHDLFGYTETEAVGHAVQDLIVPDQYQDEIRKGIKHYLKTGDGPVLNRTIEVFARHKTGKEFEVELTVSASVINGRHIFFGFTRDITNRKRLERDVLEYKNFLNSIIQNIPDLVYVKDAKTLDYILINKACEDFLGYDRDELVGKNNMELFPKEQAEYFRKTDMQVIEQRQPVEIDEEPADTQTGRRWLHTKKIPVTDEVGRVKWLLGISHDITERKQLENEKNKATNQLRENEERMALILENIGEGVIVADQDNRIVLTNLMAEDIFETDHIDNIDWTIDWDIYFPDGKTVFPAQNLPLEKGLRGEIMDAELILQHPDTKKKKLLQVTGRPIRNDKGKVIAAVATIKDVTKVKKMQKELEESRKVIGFRRDQELKEQKAEEQTKEKRRVKTERKDRTEIKEKEPPQKNSEQEIEKKETDTGENTNVPLIPPSDDDTTD